MYCYLYDDPKSGRFALIPWDLNMAFGNFQMGAAADHLEWDVFSPWAGWRKTLIERVLAVPEHRTKYLEILKGLCKREFSTKAMAERIEALHALTFDAAKEDSQKEYPTATLVKSISEDVQISGGPVSATAFGLKQFVVRRAASILDQLEGISTGKALRGRAPGEGWHPVGPPRGDPIKDWDRNGDGKVSREEWRGPVREFDRLDRNGDGYVEAKELRRR